MTKSEYKIVQVHDSNADQTDDGKEYDDDYTENINGDRVTVTSANDSDDPHFSYKAAEKHTMQTPSTIISLIFIYFVLSIGLTFYQRSLLKVNAIFHANLAALPLTKGNRSPPPNPRLSRRIRMHLCDLLRCWCTF